MNELDICECGDYRRDHVDGIGECRMPNDLSHGFQKCSRFRLSMTAEKKAIFDKIAEIVKSGYAGMLPNGNIVDRREHPNATPIQKNAMLGAPAPLPIK